MPSAAVILQELARMSEEQRSAAILWHGALVALLLALAFGVRPRVHLARVALVTPLASVSVFAWSYDNTFNGMVFGLWAALLAMLGAHAPSARTIARGPFLEAAAGALMIALGWVYPHFMRDPSWWRLLVEAPIGVIPCPTLLVVVGLALMGGGLQSSSWSLALSALGLFYGVFGAWHLGVQIDWVLCAGSLILIWTALRRI